MKIGNFTDVYTPQINGVVTSIITYGNELRRKGHSVFVFAPKIPGHNIDDRWTFRFPSVQSLAYPQIRESVPLNPKIIALIPKLGMDIFHIQSPGQIGLLGIHLAIRYNLPAVFSYHTHYPEYFTVYKKATPSLILGLLAYPIIVKNPAIYMDILRIVKDIKKNSDWTREIAEKLSAVFSNQTDGVISPSLKITKLLKKWGVKKPIATIPTGIDLNEFKGTFPKFRKKLGIDSGDFLVTYMGRIGSEKKIDLAISAFDRLAKKYRHLKFAVIGDGPYKKELAAKAKQLESRDRIIFTGFIKRKHAIGALKETDLFVFPSVTDTQGLVVLEAAACGVPAVLVDREITGVLVDGKNGFYARDNVADFAKKMEKIIVDDKLRKRFAAESKKLAGRYSASKLAAELLRFYSDRIKERDAKTIRNPKALL